MLWCRYTIMRQRINSFLLKLQLLKQYFDVDVVWFQMFNFTHFLKTFVFGSFSIVFNFKERHPRCVC